MHREFRWIVRQLTRIFEIFLDLGWDNSSVAHARRLCVREIAFEKSGGRASGVGGIVRVFLHEINLSLHVLATVGHTVAVDLAAKFTGCSQSEAS